MNFSTGWKSQIFPTPLSFNALDRSDPYRNYGNLYWSRQLMVEIWWSYLALFLTDPPVWQAHGRMDRQTELRWLRHAITVPAVAFKTVLTFQHIGWSPVVNSRQGSCISSNNLITQSLDSSTTTTNSTTTTDIKFNFHVWISKAY